MLNQSSKECMAAEEAARFMEGGFGQLDLSDFPDLTHPPMEIFELQDRLGFNRVANQGSQESIS